MEKNECLVKNVWELKKRLFSIESLRSDLNSANTIFLFAKLKTWFKIETPIGDYNADWHVGKCQGQDENHPFDMGRFERSQNSFLQTSIDNTAFIKLT